MSFTGRLKKRLMIWFIGLITKKLYRLITAEDLLQEKIDGLYIKGRKLEPDKEQILRENAEEFIDSALYNLIVNQAEYDAYERMFRGELSEDNQLAGRMQLHVVEVIKQIIHKLAQTP